MKHVNIKAIIALCAFIAGHCVGCDTLTPSYFSPRSKSVNLARIRTNWTEQTHILGADSYNSTLSIDLGYSHSINADKIRKYLFGNSIDCGEISISGSGNVDTTSNNKSLRGNCDWLADYFGLGRTYDGVITFKPKISSVFADLAFHMGLDAFKEGLWLTIWTSLEHTKWDLNFCERKISASGQGFADGYFSPSVLSDAHLLSDALDFFQKGQAPRLSDSDIFEPLGAARWGSSDTCKTYLTKTGLADLRFAFGYDFLQRKAGHIGLGLVIAAPTGTCPKGEHLFEPILGNGKHWELGLAWTSHALLRESVNQETKIELHIDANITHLFNAKQKRVFDLCGKPMSRYMLAMKLGTPTNQLWAAPDNNSPVNDMEQPSAQFKGQYAPVANLTHSDVKVSVGIQADFIAMLDFAWNNFSFDMGYNLWARSCEKIKLVCNDDCKPRFIQEAGTWALKGDAHTYAFGGTNITTTALRQQPVALSATQSFATIFSGGNICHQGSSEEQATNSRRRNPVIDNAQWANISPLGQGMQDYRDTLVFSDDQPGLNIDGTTNRINKHSLTSKDPVFIKQGDIAVDSKPTHALTHSFFMYFNYCWKDSAYAPYVGVGVQGEFAHNERHCKTNCNDVCGFITCEFDNNPCTISSNATKSCCKSCVWCGLSQFTVWAKGGVSFD